MNIKISRGALRGTVQMISSKSDAHRLFIGAALADQPTEMVLNGSSEDLEAFSVCRHWEQIFSGREIKSKCSRWNRKKNWL